MALPHVGSKLDGPNGPNSIELVEFIGSGAFGFVYRATDLVDAGQYAVKLPQVGLFGGERELAAFRNELMAATKVRHANVTQVLFVNVDAPYLVLEFMPGGTLKTRLDVLRSSKTQVPLEALRAWLLELVAGMKAINDVVLHRDIKPDNILLASDGSLRVSDFGLAKLVGAATRSTTFKGGQHVFYMAPEGWQQETNLIQTDMYAVGITMFEMCTLTFPFTIPSDRDLEAMHLFKTPTLARSVRADLTPSMEQVLIRLMAKRPADRFANWDEVAAAIQRAFGTNTPKTSTTGVQAILSAASAAHQANAAKVAAEQEKQKAQDRRRGIHEFQREKLLDQFRPLISAFNEQSQLGQASIRETASAVTFAFPHMSIDVVFSDFGERRIPMGQHDNREIHFFARIENENHQGFNAVLVHTGDDDMYGEWQGWEIGIWALAREPVDGRVHGERFGLDERRFYDNFQYSNGVTHVYTYRRLSDFATRFAELANEVRRRR